MLVHSFIQFRPGPVGTPKKSTSKPLVLEVIRRDDLFSKEVRKTYDEYFSILNQHFVEFHLELKPGPELDKTMYQHLHFGKCEFWSIKDPAPGRTPKNITHPIYHSITCTNCGKSTDNPINYGDGEYIFHCECGAATNKIYDREKM